ncbi:MAG: polyprenyl synthetase family protein [Porticoccaceae bacterium]|nr:polyprenyl synthetase family protein [Porticoccaceae bacterium]|tara:strand:+ start:1937 stop:2815 length:879 start_codon:yes stop_codon:yes gene_type:complete
MNLTIEGYVARVNAQLDKTLPLAEGPAERLLSAMRYSVLNGGKRLRPLLCFAAADAIAEANHHTEIAAASVEMIHAYSLIHDDLPAMDDDDLRRGKPSCHIQFDEATAILAGDALQAMAFEQLATMRDIPPVEQVELIRLLANHSGSSGMVAGQAIDLAATGESLTLDQLKFMHTHKTGALIETSVLMGAVATTKATAAQLKALSRFARAIGLAFQIQDDILDVESSTAQLGKQQGSDAAKGKPTYIALLGLDDARAQVDELYKESIACLELFGDRAEPLRYIAGFIVNRAY